MRFILTISLPLFCQILTVPLFATPSERPSVYLDSNKSPNSPAKIASAYETRYRIEDFSKLKNTTDPEFLKGRPLKIARDTSGKQISGLVLVAFIIGTDGRVSDPTVLVSDDNSASATVLEAVKQWRYSPATTEGKPVATIQTRIFSFKPVTKTGFGSSEIFFFQSKKTRSSRILSEDNFTAYIQKLNAVCSTFFKGADTPESFYIVVIVQPGQHTRIWFDTPDSGSLYALQDLKKQLEAVSPPATAGGPIAFAIYANIAGGDGWKPAEIDRGYTPPIPDEWNKANRPEEDYFTDAFFNRVWFSD